MFTFRCERCGRVLCVDPADRTVLSWLFDVLTRGTKNLECPT